jgi:hypothetical protein
MARSQISTEQLSWGLETPGNSKYYGTDWGGTEWYFDLPASWWLGSWTWGAGNILWLVVETPRGQYLNDSPWILLTNNREVALPSNYMAVAPWHTDRDLANVFPWWITSFAWDDGTFMYVSSESSPVHELRQIPRASDYTNAGNWTLLYDAAVVTWVTYNDLQFCGIGGNWYAVWYDDNWGTIYEIDNAWVIQSTTGWYTTGAQQVIANPNNITLINKFQGNPTSIRTSVIGGTALTIVWWWVETANNRDLNLMIIDDILYMQARSSTNANTIIDWVTAVYPVYKIV